MSKNVAAVLGIAVLAASFAAAQANPRGEAKVTLEGKSVAIDYGRPSLKGRDMLGQAEVGKSWRMGADAATTLKTEAELSFGSAVVPAGDYILTAKKVAEGKWHIEVRASDEGRTVVAEIPLEATKLDEPVETFTIKLGEHEGAGKLALMWGDKALATAFSAK